MKQIPLDIGLVPRPRLDTWVAGPNAQVLAHVQQLVTHPLATAAPTYIWGDEGSGKTHLLLGALQELQEQGLTAGWLDADTICSGYVLEFDPRWSAVFMDDVDLYNDEQQHTAFNWFINAMAPLQGEPRWVLAAGSLPVTDLPLREDLRTRLGWGQVYALQPLGDDDVRAALRRAAAERGIVLSDEVPHFMLKRFSRDLGSLNELLGMLDGYSLETRRNITIPLLKQMLHET